MKQMTFEEMMLLGQEEDQEVVQNNYLMKDTEDEDYEYEDVEVV